MDSLFDLSFLLIVVDVTLAQSTLLNLDLLIQVMKFFISLNKLCGENISLIHDHFIVFVLLCLFSFSLLDDILQTTDIVLLSLDHLIR